MDKQASLAQQHVVVVTVVFGDRWHFLKQTLEALVTDQKVKTIIIVDNNSKNPEAMDVYARQYLHKIVILRQEKNIGFSGAISKGVVRAKETDSQYVLIMDDDCVLEEGGIDMFLDNYKYFPNNRVVMVGNRVDVPGTLGAFKRPSIASQYPNGTIFEVFSSRKVINLIKLILGKKENPTGPFIPVFPTQAFVTGGSFYPMQLLREIDPYDTSFFIYGEDLDFAWRAKKAGFLSYQCARPIIHDIDLTFPEEGGHIWGLFQEKTPDYKVYYRMRNSVIISRRHTYQSKLSLLLNIKVWFIGLFILGAFKHSSWKTYIHRVKLITRAVADGYKHPDSQPPAYLKTPS
jgi:GT2 family glycosyltransferase